MARPLKYTLGEAEVLEIVESLPFGVSIPAILNEVAHDVDPSTRKGYWDRVKYVLKCLMKQGIVLKVDNMYYTKGRLTDDNGL